MTLSDIEYEDHANGDGSMIRSADENRDWLLGCEKEVDIEPTSDQSDETQSWVYRLRQAFRGVVGPLRRH
jgi:hypothetical protein